MATKKLTQKELFAQIIANYNLSKEHKAFLEGRIEALEKKSASKANKASAKQTENDKIKDNILASMEIGESYTITDMLKNFECCANLTNQKASALVRQLKEDGLVERTESKGKAYFSLVVAEVDED